jgi:starch synthase
MQVRIDVFDKEVRYFLKQDKGVDWVFVDHECYPRPGGLYADNFGVYGDNQVRPRWLGYAAAK